MEYSQLKEFLKCARDLEGAVNACESAVATLKGELNKPDSDFIKIPNLILPKAPTLEYIPKPELPGNAPSEDLADAKAELESREIYGKDPFSVSHVYRVAALSFFSGLVISVLILFFIFEDADAVERYEGIAFVVPIIAALIGVTISVLRRRSRLKQKITESNHAIHAAYEADQKQYQKQLAGYWEAEAEYKRKTAEAQKRYQLAMQEYEEECNTRKAKRMTEIRMANQFLEQYRNMLRAQIEKLLERQRELNTKLQKLYDENGLYPDYQNSIAVAYLYKYIESGICRTLEGADGAYAQYESECRTQQITRSVEQLNRDVNLGFERVSKEHQAIYSGLGESYRKLGALHNSLLGLGQEVRNMTNSLQSEVHAMSSDVLGQLNSSQRSLELLTKRAAQIESSTRATSFNTSLIALNQYLDAKSRDVDAYYATYF